MDNKEKNLNDVDPTSPDKSIWVSANAGSGKTRNLVFRVARILLKGVLPQKILCLTYTNAAAMEMQNRLFTELGSWSMKVDFELENILASMGEEIPQMKAERLNFFKQARQLFARALETPGGLKVLTIHGFCSSILAKFPLEAGVTPNFQVMDERRRNIILTQSYSRFAKTNPQKFELGVSFINQLNKRKFIEQILGLKTVLNKEFNVSLFCKSLNLETNLQNPEEEWNKIFLDLPNEILKVFINLIEKSDKPSDLSQLKKLKEAIEVSPEAALKLLLDFFTTKDGRTRLNPISRNQLKNWDEKLIDYFFNVQSRIIKYQQKLFDYKIIENASKLYAFSNGLLLHYQKEKINKGLIDYDDLLTKTFKVLKNVDTKWVLFKLDDKIDHILIDEAQDTAPIQWNMLVELMDDFFSDLRAKNGGRTLYVVGDQKQSIYSFQGADPQEFELKRNYFAGKLSSLGGSLQELNLSKSYRSSKVILNLVNQISLNGEDLGVKTGTIHRPFYEEMPGRVELWPLAEMEKTNKQLGWWLLSDESQANPAEDKLATSIAVEIKNILDSEILIPTDSTSGKLRKVQPGDFLILVKNRSGTLFDSILRTLHLNGLEVLGSDQINLMEDLAIRDLLSLLKFLSNPSDDLSLAEAMRSPLLGISEVELFKICFDRPGTLYESFATRMRDHDATFILRDLLQEAQKVLPYELIEKILVNHGGRLRLLSRLGDGVDDLIDEFLAQALKYEETEPPSLEGFLKWISALDFPVKRRLLNNQKKIKVMTIHGAKGLESPIVIVPQTTRSHKAIKSDEIHVHNDWAFLYNSEKQLSAGMKKIKEKEIKLSYQEDNRLLYVALTRARNWLIICGAGSKLKQEDSQNLTWYEQCQNAFASFEVQKLPAPYGLVGEKKVLQYKWPGKNGSNDCYKLKSSLNREVKKLPTWLNCKVDTAKKKNKILNASEIVSYDKAVTKGSLTEYLNRFRQSEGAKEKGLAVHAFLQLLPSVPVERYPFLVEQVAKHLGINKESLIYESFKEAEHVLSKQEFSFLLSDNCLREVSVSGLIDLSHLNVDFKTEEMKFDGRLDCLHVTDSEVLIIDFKTDAKIPKKLETINIGYVVQLQIYASLLKSVYPKHKIKTGIIWTKSAEFMPVELDRMSDDLSSYFLSASS